jgi:hypothetical protein
MNTFVALQYEPSLRVKINVIIKLWTHTYSIIRMKSKSILNAQNRHWTKEHTQLNVFKMISNVRKKFNYTIDIIVNNIYNFICII